MIHICIFNRGVKSAKLNHYFFLQAYSTVGTPDYIAPEVLLKKGYGMECDWYVYVWLYCSLEFV